MGVKISKTSSSCKTRTETVSKQAKQVSKQARGTDPIAHN
jgi:hypothetical protein